MCGNWHPLAGADIAAYSRNWEAEGEDFRSPCNLMEDKSQNEEAVEDNDVERGEHRRGHQSDLQRVATTEENQLMIKCDSHTFEFDDWNVVVVRQRSLK